MVPIYGYVGTMKFSRRRFLLGTALTLAFASRAESGLIHRGGSLPGSMVINAGGSPLGFMNMVKGVQFQSTATVNWPSLLSANGYPSGSVTFTANAVQGDPTYFGRYLVWWDGMGGFQLQHPGIIYAGGQSVAGVGTSTGTNLSNIAIGGSANQPNIGGNGAVEFAFGALITAVGTNGGLIQFTVGNLNFSNGIPTGTTATFNNLTYNGGAFPAGPNADGSWTLTLVGGSSGSQYTLQGSSGLTAGLIALNASGTVGVNSEMIYQPVSSGALGSIGYSFPRTTGFLGWNNWFWVKKADQTSALAGQLASSSYISIFKQLNPRFVRFMDYTAVQGDRSSAYAFRTPAGNMSWPVNYINPNYYVGAITNGGSDAYTCSNPIASGVGAYAEGEVVIGQISGANAAINPTLNVNSRGAKPICDISCNLQSLFLSGSVPGAGVIISMQFTGGGLASPRTITYTVQAGDTTFTTLANNMAAAVNADATLTAKNISCQNADTGSAQKSFYYCPNINSSGVASLNAGMVISITDNSGGGSGTVYGIGFVRAGFLANSAYDAFTYSNALGAWVTTPGNTGIGGVHGAVPIEWMTDLCTRANVGMWLNVGAMWSDDRIYNTVLQIAQSGVKELCLELMNETWNSGLAEWRPARVFGTTIINTDTGSGKPESSWVGLRTLQMAAQARAAWAAAGRARSQLFVDIAFQFVDMNATATTNTCTYKFNGSLLNASGTGTSVTLKAFGGYGCAAITTDYSSAPNRPVDFADCVGGAPYWQGGQFNNNLQNGNFSTAVPLAAYNGLLLAAYNYVYGTPTQQAAALDFCYSGSQIGTGDLYNAQLNGSTFGGGFSALAALAIGSGDASHQGYCGIGGAVATYDTGRLSLPAGQVGQTKLGVACYEGGWFMAPVGLTDATTTFPANLNTLGYTNGYASSLPGAASGGPTGASDTSANIGNCVALLLNGLGGPWTVNGSPNASMPGFKNDARCLDLVTRYLNECLAAGVTGGARLSLPCWYGFQGNTAVTGNYFSPYLGEPTFPIVPAATKAIPAFQALDSILH